MTATALSSGVSTALRRAGLTEVDDSRRRRAEYSSDASIYRVAPTVVAFPRHVEEILAALDVARTMSVPLTMRGAGTSIAGNAIGSGIVLDTSRHLGRVLQIDPARRVATVEPGCVMATLQREAAVHGLRFGPDPSSWTRATLGGMIGNNACGPHALAFGKTAQNVETLDWVDGTGRRFTAGYGDWGYDSVPGLHELVTSRLGVIRTELGTFARQVSGYSLEHLLPENGSHLARALVGSEGTLGIVLGAELNLVQVPAAPTLVVLGYPDMATAADAVPALLRHRPLAIEGLDSRLVDLVRAHRGAARVPDLPAGKGWLMVEVGGQNAAQAESAARALAADAATTDTLVVPAGDQAVALWRIREDGAGLGGRTPGGAQGWAGWEDAAVPAERLGTYLREFDALLAEHGLSGIPYGHFGDGCVHIRIDFPLASGTGSLRPFLRAAAQLVAGHGGSVSGEHGDGRARSELLPIMYSAQALELFAGFRALLDPQGLLNPGVIVDPVPLDCDVRRSSARTVTAAGGFAFLQDGGNITDAVHRCTGVGKCRADLSGAGGFMCPSFLATLDEKDSTRGRARVLQDLTNGRLVPDWDSPEVEQALELCLACKACASDCPTGIDMAMYKSEALYRRYRGRRRPAAHYALGRLPQWARLAGLAPPLVNALAAIGPLRRAGMGLAGLDRRRSMPTFASVPFRVWRRRHAPPPAESPRGEVLLFVDTFSDAFDPAAAVAAVQVLTDAGYRVRLPRSQECCGLTWITTGQLDGARDRLRPLVNRLLPAAAAGVPIVGLEPSCTAVLATDLVELLPGDEDAAVVAGATTTLARMLLAAADDGWQPPSLAGLQVLAQPHCHQHATFGFDADRRLLELAGAELTTIASCCGMAGNFGMEAGHYEVSRTVAENGFLAALAAASARTVVLADGFLCRTQIADLAGRTAAPLAVLLASRLRARSGG